MTTLRSVLQLASFRGAVQSLIEVDPDRDVELRTTLGVDAVTIDQNPGDPEWESATRALSLIYETASREGVADVIADVRKAMPTIDDDEAERLVQLIAPDELVTERIEGSRQRDSFLPILSVARFSLDLRFIDVAGGKKLVPVVTARLQFDEHVGGSDATVFQIPVSAIPGLAKELTELAETIPELDNRIRDISIPDWSREIN
ncbi:hypothetical protein [Mycetocola zhujimingii]|uniref:hypothetical protein n=1 Tax=Mycetocola zhujimingii TaxID=2079792 RepID=UPI000D3BD1E5|nr:hypothetical protein [Mycetocola zhujimingii]AWB85504.1 hypothetical protein C3E77_01900 [Mycetocola zhujimingii]